jgi:FkbM family methyltransferase
MITKIKTYSRYFWDNLLNGEFRAIYYAFRYLLFKKSSHKDVMIKSRLGKFYTRKGTNDFMFANYGYEWNVKKFFLKNLENYDVFLDIGSCIGTYSIMMAKNNLKCFAFEPVQKNFQVLATNILLNDFSNNITAFKFGLGAECNSSVPFFFDSTNTGASHKVTSKEKANTEVEIRDFDSVIGGLDIDKNDRILIKVDIEGMELEFLEGAKQFIKEFPSILFMIESFHSGKKEIMDKLSSITDFEFKNIDNLNISAKKK